MNIQCFIFLVVHSIDTFPSVRPGSIFLQRTDLFPWEGTNGEPLFTGNGKTEYISSAP
jgi:hypothetical protein